MDTHLAFSLERTQIRNRILIPKYYDPDIELAARRAGERFDLPRLGDLLLSGPSGSQLGDWIPRELYGTGTIPYVRTSDLSRWRIRADYKKGVSEQVYLAYRNKQDVRADDILLVAHGTYLVGNVALVTEEDSRLVLQDHVFRLRINPETGVNPCYLLAALSTSFVRRQIRARRHHR
jgi:type I restriction enzyme M protein